MATSEMEKVLYECMKVGGDAISLEGEQRNYEAYRKYLLCCYKVFLVLSTEVNSMKAENSHMRLKLAKLARDCAERVVEYCNQPDKRMMGKTRTGSLTSPTMSPHQSYKQLPKETSSEYTAKPSTKAATPQRHSTSGQSVSNGSTTASQYNSDDPELVAQRQNRLLWDSHKKRLENLSSDPARRANLTLSVQKRMMENMEIAKRKKSEWELRLIERQQKLKDLADRRIASLKLADSTKEKQHNDLLRTIYLHDDKYKWPLTSKAKLSEGGSLNQNNTAEFCRNILRSDTHPLAVFAQDCQKTVREVASPLYNKYSKLITECVSVPYEYKAPELSDQAVEELEQEISGSAGGAASSDANFEACCEDSVEQVNLAIEGNEKAVKKLDNFASKPVSKEDTKDDMDSLFDSDEENVSEESSVTEQPQSTLPRTESQLSEVLREKRIDDLEDIQSMSESLQKQLSKINSVIHQTMYTVKTLLMLAYEDLNCSEGCDIIHEELQQHIFNSFGDELQFVFRIASLERERKMAEVMTKYMSEDIRTLKVKEKWCLETGGECYSHLVTQLQTIKTVSSPLQKMSCAVKVNKGVVETTKSYFQARGQNEPMGADDLLPIICYIVLKSEQPHIYSQCAMMEEFVPAEFMMEEEGYTLSTFLMAVQYLLTL